jgi:hypothetical protein
VFDGVEAGEIEILADDWSRTVKAALQHPGVFVPS